MARNLTFSLDIGWRTLLKDFGLKPEHVLRKAGLPEDLFARVGRGLDTDEYFRFWRALELEAGDAMFPLHLLEMVSAEVFDPPLFAALCSANLMQAVQRLAKYKQLVAPMGSARAERPEVCAMSSMLSSSTNLGLFKTIVLNFEWFGRWLMVAGISAPKVIVPALKAPSRCEPNR